MNRIICLVLLSIISLQTKAQDDLLKSIGDSLPKQQKVAAAFKSTRVINAHSMEMLAKGHLDFRILHRFGRVSQGINQFFGLDAASFRMGFDYGLTDNIMAGIGRSTFRKELDAFVKGRLFQQTRGEKSIPFSLLIAAGMTVWTEQSFAPVKPTFSDRSAYYIQLIAGRKFSESFSFQLSPIWVHRNSVETAVEKKDVFAPGAGARFKVSRRVALTADYHHPLAGIAAESTDPVSVGVDIETGGHVFQLHFSNSTGMNERAYITQTSDKFFKGDIRFGFNLSRIFRVKRYSVK